MASILVTGASGFLGSALITRLLRDGHRVIGIARHKGRFLNKEVFKDKNFRFIACDISRDFNGLLSGIPVDIIYHLASRQPSAKGISYSDFYSGNVKTTQNVITLCAKKPVKAVIYVSTVAIYGKAQKGKRLNEKTPVKPDNYYALTKYIAEELLWTELAHSGTSLYVVRLPSLFGKNHLGGIVHTYFTLADAGKPITVFNKGKTLRNILYVNDAVEVLRKICASQRQLKKKELFILGSNNSIRTSALARVVKRLAGSSSKVVIIKKNMASNFDIRINSAKAKRALKFKPSPVKEALAAYIKEKRDEF